MLQAVTRRDLSQHGKVQHTSDVVPGKLNADRALSASEIVAKYREKDKLGVPDMRKWMKVMVAEIFFAEKYSCTHKCRGIWKDKPSEWPSDVPYCDPNNAERPEISQQKPSKNTLTAMMKYLVGKFEESHRCKKFDSVSLDTVKSNPGQEPERQTLTNMPWAQPTEEEEDWKAIVEASHVWFDNSSSGPVEENEDILHLAAEEGSLDLVSYVIDDIHGNSSQKAREEEGWQPKQPHVNVQLAQSSENQISRPAAAAAAAAGTEQEKSYTPPPALPPASKEVEGFHVSNDGTLHTHNTTAAVEYKDRDDDDASLPELDIDLNYFDVLPSLEDIMTDVFGMHQSNGNANSDGEVFLCADSFVYEYSNQPMEETTTTSHIEAVIPTVVSDYDEDMEF